MNTRNLYQPTKGNQCKDLTMVCKVFHLLDGEPFSKTLSHASILEPQTLKGVQQQLCGSKSGCPGHTAGEAVTTGSPGIPLEWRLLGYTPGGICQSQMYWHPSLKDTADRLWICIIFQWGQSKYHEVEKNLSVLPIFSRQLLRKK